MISTSLTASRTARIYCSNGTFANIAKIEGGPEYKAMMRSQPWSFSLAEQVVANESQASIALPPSNIGINDLFQDLLPSWLSSVPESQEPKALVSMLYTLYITTISAIDSRFDMVEIVLPGYATEVFMASVQSAAHRLRLKMPRGIDIPANLLMTQASKIQSPSEELLVLSIDYSRAALTSIMLVEQNGSLVAQRGTIDTTLGFDNRSPWPARRYGLG